MKLFNLSLRVKLLLPLLIGGGTIAVIGAYSTYFVAVDELRNQLIHRGELLAAAIDQSFSIAAHEFEVRLAVDELVNQEKGVSKITLATGAPLTIWASSFQPGSNPDRGTQDMLALLENAIDTGQFGHYFEPEGDLVIVAPIGLEKTVTGDTVATPELNADSFLLPVGSYRGAVYLEFDWQIIGTETRGILWKSLVIYLGGVAVLVLFTILFVSRVVLGQVNHVSRIIRRYDQGDHAVRIRSTSTDEIGMMANAFDSLLDSLKYSQGLSDKIFRASPGLSAISRPSDGMHYDVNAKWSEILGYSHQEAMEKTAGELGVWHSNEDRATFVERLKKEGSIRNFETTFVTKDGRKLDVLVAGEFLRVADEDRLLVVTTDITEKKLLEQVQRQTQKMEAVGQLTGGVAHDFNNLLAVILGNAEVLKDSVNPDLDAEVGAIIRASLRGGELTQRLLAFSRKQSLVPRTIDLGALVSGMLDMLTRTLGETIEVSVMVSPRLWNAVADPGQTENVLLNLAVNSRDAMPRGGKLTIECKNERLDENYVRQHPDTSVGDYVLLQVTDDGEGMTPEVQAQAFEPFFTTKEVGEGSGLGLSMIYGFAQQSGGHVSIDSEPGRGTTVKFYLPRAYGGKTPRDGDEEANCPRGRGETILVIEDDPGVSTLVVGMLKTLGYRVLDAPDASTAENILQQRPEVDLVLSDVVLPGGMSGPEMIQKARQAQPGLKVIFMSGYPAEEASQGGSLEAGDVLLNKPFRRSQVARTIRDALE